MKTKLLLSAALIGALAGATTSWLIRPTGAPPIPPRDDSRDWEVPLHTLEQQVTRLERELALERTETAQLRHRLGQSGPLDTGRTDPSPTPPATPRALFDALFEEVARGGSLAAIGPLGSRLVTLFESFRPEGRVLLTRHLESDDLELRIAAIRLAGRWRDGELLAPLTEIATEDRSELARIFAAEAVAGFPASLAIESWRSLLTVPGPAAVRVQAWTGLAQAGDPLAIEGFEVLLDSCDASIPADAVVDTALAMASPELSPALRAACRHPAVTPSHRIAILRTLARGTEEEVEFVREVGTDALFSEPVQAVARALAPPPPPEEESEEPSGDETRPDPSSRLSAEDGENRGESLPEPPRR